MAVKWYTKVAGQEIGPLTSQQLKQMADEKRIMPTDPVRREGDAQWSQASSVKGLFSVQPPLGTPVGELPQGRPVDSLPFSIDPVAKAPTPFTPVAPPVVAPVAAPIAAEKPAKKKKVAAPLDPPPVAPQAPTPAVDLGFSFTDAPAPSKGRKGGAQKSDDKKDSNDDEKKTLSKQEIQRRNFFILLGAAGGVIVLALLVFVIISFTGGESSEEDPAPDAATTTAEGTEKAEGEETSPDAAEEKPAEGAEQTPDAAPAEGDEAEDTEEDTEEEKDPLEGYAKLSVGVGIQDVFVKVKDVQLTTLANFTKKPSSNRGQCLFITINVENRSDEKVIEYPAWGRNPRNIVMKDSLGNSLKPVTSVRLQGQMTSPEQISRGGVEDILVFPAPPLRAEYVLLELPPVDQSVSKGFKFIIRKEDYSPELTKKEGKKATGDEKAESDDAQTEEDEELTDSGIEQGDLKVRRSSDELSASIDEVAAEIGESPGAEAEEGAFDDAPPPPPAKPMTPEDEERAAIEAEMRAAGWAGRSDSVEDEPDIQLDLSPELQEQIRVQQERDEQKRKEQLKGRTKR
ncbi:MAG: DUF4339 domain-containing protein [Planctomycetia bacterium]|nr:DUF4339 domain-containing protein [Planctomycetia bacterium]